MDSLIENQKTLENLKLVLVVYIAAELIVKLFISKRLRSLQALV